MANPLAQLVGQLILAGLAFLGTVYGIQITDTSWVGGCALAVASILSFLAAVVWGKVTHRQLLMMPPPRVAPPLMRLRVPIWFAAIVLLPAMAGGCMGGHDFQMEVPVAVTKIAAEMDVGLDEYHAAETTMIRNAAAKARSDLETALAAYLMEATKEAHNATVEDALAAIAPAFTVYDESMRGVASDLATEMDRYSRCKQLTDYQRRLSAQSAEIETLRYATYDELRAMAQSYVSAILKQTSGGAPTSTDPALALKAAGLQAKPPRIVQPIVTPENPALRPREGGASPSNTAPMPRGADK